MRKPTNYSAPFEEHLSYHIYNRSNNKEVIFLNDEHYNFFLKRFKKLILPFFDLEAFCLLPNHFHFLARVKPIDENILTVIKSQQTVASQKYLDKTISYNEFLSNQFRRLFLSYAKAFNKQQNRTGSVFQTGFKRVLIKTDFKWFHILAYIHHNPIHHHLRKDYETWKFSSYLIFLSEKTTLMSRTNVLRRFDDNMEIAKKEFIAYHQAFKLEKGMDDLYLDDDDDI